RHFFRMRRIIPNADVSNQVDCWGNREPALLPERETPLIVPNVGTFAARDRVEPPHPMRRLDCVGTNRCQPAAFEIRPRWNRERIVLPGPTPTGPPKARGIF